MQMVRITTQDGKKVEGLLNVTKDSNGNVKEMYVDIGVDSADEVKALGIDVVTWFVLLVKQDRFKIK